MQRLVIEQVEATDDASLRSVLASALFKHAVTLRQSGDIYSAAAIMRRVAEQFQDVAPSHQPRLAQDALFFAMVYSHRIGDNKATATAAETYLAGCAGERQPPPRRIAEALSFLSRSYAADLQHERELATLQRLIARFKADDHDRHVRYHLAAAMYMAGVRLRDRGDGEGAVKMWESLFERFSPDPPEQDPLLPWAALYQQAEWLSAHGRGEEAGSLVQRLVERMQRTDDDPRHCRHLAEMTLAAGNFLARRGVLSEALKTYTDIWQSLRDSPAADQEAIAIRALINRGWVLARLGEFRASVEINESLFTLGDAAVSALDRIGLDAKAGHELSPERGAWALLMKAVLLQARSDEDAAVEVLQDLMATYGDSDVPVIRPIVQNAEALLVALKKPG